MPSARELLEQADALMRRNRARETMSPAMGPRTMTPTIAARQPAAAPADFPVLTEAMEERPVERATPVTRAAPPAPAGTMSASRAPSLSALSALPASAPPPSALPPSSPSFSSSLPALPPSAPSSAPVRPVPPPAAMRAPMETAHPIETAHDLRNFAEPTLRAAPASSQPIASVMESFHPPAAAFTDVPVLTDAIREIDAALIAAAAQGEPSIWNDEAMQGDDSVLGPAPKSIAVIPDAHAIDESHRRNLQAAAEESAAAAATASAVAASTAELIDEVRMQVLQRIDMFTDTGLREQLGERLKPIVDRASAELVATINQHVGELLRTYVAEAIERELDRLRNELR